MLSQATRSKEKGVEAKAFKGRKVELLLYVLAIFTYFGFVLFTGGEKIVYGFKNDTRIQFAISRRWLLFPQEKVDVAWFVKGESAKVFLNGKEQAIEDKVTYQLDRHKQFDLKVVFADKVEKTLKLNANILLLAPLTWILLFLAGVFLYEALGPPAKTAELDEKTVYFPGLNGARFIAAMAVLLGHVSEILESYNLKSLEIVESSYYYSNIGSKAVTLFFCLSGFLLTYLLLVENKRTGTINIRSFYVRRFLRIWPLYYFVFFVGFFVVPMLISYPGVESLHKDYWTKFGLYFFLLPNLADTLGMTVWFIAHIWSIGTEEQFYLVWPVLLKKFKTKIAWVLACVVLLTLCADISLLYKNSLPQSKLLDAWYTFFHYANTFRMESIAIGCLGAYLFYSKESLKKIVFHPVVERLTLASLIYMTINYTYWMQFDTYIYALLATVFILNLAANPNTVLKLENKWFSYFGKISYGIYMYHSMVICFVVVMVANLKLQEQHFLGSQLLVYTLSIGGTLLLSAVSYRLLEKPFLKMKSSFTVVPSTNDKRAT